MSAAVLTRTLDEELKALLAGESEECAACGEPVVAKDDALECAACGSRLESGRDLQVQLRLQAG